MTLLPPLEETAKAAAVRDLDSALGWLAAWCTHGMNSSRVGDYIAADMARTAITDALAALGVPRATSGPELIGTDEDDTRPPTCEFDGFPMEAASDGGWICRHTQHHPSDTANHIRASGPESKS